VRARKEYRARKKLEAELRQEREARIAADARFQALDAHARERTAREAAAPARDWTDEEVQAALEARKITVAEAASYIAKRDYKTSMQMQAVREKQDREERTAKSELAGYAEAVPGLQDGTHPKFAQVKDSLSYMVYTLGLANTTKTRLLALREVFGPLAKLQQQAESQRLTRNRRDGHAEVTGGPPMGTDTTTHDPLAKVPKHFLEFWQKRGYSREEMLAEAKYITAQELRDGYRKSRLDK